MNRLASHFAQGATRLSFALVVAGVLSLPSFASAVPCTPKFDYLTNDPAEKVLVGCCKADGSAYMANGADCLNADNVCQEGDCSVADANGVKTCNQPASGWRRANDGGACVVTDASGNPLCELGECNAQVCIRQTDPQSRCNDNNDCTDDVCAATTVYKGDSSGGPVHCTITNDDSNSCLFPDSDPCTDGVCSSGTCLTHQVSAGTPCSSVLTGSPPSCQIKTCDAVGLCQDNGSTVPCNGTLGLCRQWTCSLANGCFQINAGTDLASSQAAGCETDTHDCKKKRCNTTGHCSTTKETPNTYVCDTNFSSAEKIDCLVGVCDGQKKCVNEFSAGYNGQECADAHTCTIATCLNGVCGPAASCHGSERTCPGCPGVVCDSNQNVSNNCNCAN